MFKFSKIFFILILPLLTGVTMYYIVNAYIEPANLSASPNTKIDVGESSQNKLGNLSISFIGTTTISSSSVALITGSNMYMLIPTSTNNSKTFAVQFDGNIIPLGFMWKKGNNGGLYIDGGLSIGTTSASNSLTITNGTPSSSIINIGGDASNTIAVGAYYDTIAKVWKVTNPTHPTQPMAIAFDPSGGLWLEAGGTPPYQNGVFYWRNSMHITPNGDVIFSDRYATSSYKVWANPTTVDYVSDGTKIHSAEEYCSYPENINDCTTTMINNNTTTYITIASLVFNVSSSILDCNIDKQNPQNSLNPYVYFGPEKLLSGPSGVLRYECSVGDNNPVNNKSTVVGGNFFVAHPHYTDSKWVPNPNSNSNGNWDGVWLTCPDGYFMSGFSFVSPKGVECSKQNIK